MTLTVTVSRSSWVHINQSRQGDRRAGLPLGYQHPLAGQLVITRPRRGARRGDLQQHLGVSHRRAHPRGPPPPAASTPTVSRTWEPSETEHRRSRNMRRRSAGTVIVVDQQLRGAVGLHPIAAARSRRRQHQPHRLITLIGPIRARGDRHRPGQLAAGELDHPRTPSRHTRRCHTRRLGQPARQTPAQPASAQPPAPRPQPAPPATAGTNDPRYDHR